MDARAESIQSFRANGLHIGGVYPFRISRQIPQRFDTSDIFVENFADREPFKNFKRKMYGAEQKWPDPDTILYFETALPKCTLSNGREFKEVPFKSYLSIYPPGFATLIFWVDLSKDSFNLEEIVELTALARGTNERVSKSQESSINLQWKHHIEEAYTFKRICELLEKELPIITPDNHLSDGSAVKSIYPIVYIHEVPDCESAQDIINKHDTVVCGIGNLWDKLANWLKREEIQRMVQTDFHPFEFGLTCLSSVCAVELHPKNLKQAAEARGQSVDEHHYEERTVLSFLCETALSQVFILGTFDEELVKMQRSLPPPGYSHFLNPIYPFTLFRRATRLTTLHEELTRSLRQFQNICLTRKRYIPTAIDLMRYTFGADKVEESVNRKLVDLQNDLQMTYSMLTTLLLIILSIISAIFGLIIAIDAARDLGWLKWLW